MTVLTKTIAAQYPMVAVFEVPIITDTCLNVAGSAVAFKTAAPVFPIIQLPIGAQVVGGDLTVVTASDDSVTATVAIGDSATADRYLAATDIKTGGRTALVPTGYETLSTTNRIYLTFANAGADAAAGKLRITVVYIDKTKVNEPSN